MELNQEIKNCSITYLVWAEVFDMEQHNFDHLSIEVTTDLLSLISSDVNQMVFIEDTEAKLLNLKENHILMTTGFNIEKVDIDKSYYDYEALKEFHNNNDYPEYLNTRLGFINRAIESIIGDIESEGTDDGEEQI